MLDPWLYRYVYNADVMYEFICGLINEMIWSRIGSLLSTLCIYHRWGCGKVTLNTNQRVAVSLPTKGEWRRSTTLLGT